VVGDELSPHVLPDVEGENIEGTGVETGVAGGAPSGATCQGT
jgi:hypothetical protein